MQRIELLCACWAGFCLSSAVSHTTAEEPAPRGRWALLVGVDGYAHLAKLRFCSADMRSLGDQLARSGFPPEQVFLLDDKAEENRYRPLKSNIDTQLDLVLRLVEPDDLLLVAFSGHGVQMDGKSYLCPADARLNDKTTLVSLDALYKQLEECRASLKLLLVDACRDDPRPAGLRRAGAPANFAKGVNVVESTPEGILLMSSCAPGQVSWEDEESGHGVFMYYLLEGLKGRADSDNNGWVSLFELYKHANAQTKVRVARKCTDIQTPALKADIADDFDIARLEANRSGGDFFHRKGNELSIGGIEIQTAQDQGTWTLIITDAAPGFPKGHQGPLAVFDKRRGVFGVMTNNHESTPILTLTTLGRRPPNEIVPLKMDDAFARSLALQARGCESDQARMASCSGVFVIESKTKGFIPTLFMFGLGAAADVDNKHLTIEPNSSNNGTPDLFLHVKGAKLCPNVAKGTQTFPMRIRFMRDFGADPFSIDGTEKPFPGHNMDMWVNGHRQFSTLDRNIDWRRSGYIFETKGSFHISPLWYFNTLHPDEQKAAAQRMKRGLQPAAQ